MSERHYFLFRFELETACLSVPRAAVWVRDSLPPAFMPPETALTCHAEPFHLEFSLSLRHQVPHADWVFARAWQCRLRAIWAFSCWQRRPAMRQRWEPELKEMVTPYRKLYIHDTEISFELLFREFFFFSFEFPSNIFILPSLNREYTHLI